MRRSLFHFGAGVAAGVVFLVALLVLDTGGLRSLIAHDRAVFLPLFLLLVDLGGLFGMAVMISSLTQEEGAGPRGGHRIRGASWRGLNGSHVRSTSGECFRERPAGFACFTSSVDCGVPTMLIPLLLLAFAVASYGLAVYVSRPEVPVSSLRLTHLRAVRRLRSPNR